MSLGRIAQESKPTDNVVDPISHSTSGISINGGSLHSSVLELFNIKANDIDNITETKLRDISDWAFDGQTFIGDGLIKIRELIERIPPLQKDKYNSVWNLIMLQKRIDQSRKELDDLEKRKIAIYKDNRPTIRMGAF